MKGKRIRELGGIVPQMHHPNNRFKKKKKKARTKKVKWKKLLIKSFNMNCQIEKFH